MVMEVAADAFDELAARHQRSSTRANCRILLLALFVGVITTVVIVLAVDATRTSAARRYAAAVSWQQKASLHCDAALGRRRLWFGKVVTASELCVPEHVSPSAVRSFGDSSLTFLVVGDWGRDGMCCQRDVAVEMSLAAEQINPNFVVSVGDNFYEHGISSPSDGQVARSWRDVYINPYTSMHKIRWMLILGNHDHQTNVDAQVELTKMDSLWHMPKRYFFESSEDGKVFMAFLDTTVMFYGEDELRANFSGEAITAAYRDKQLGDFKQALTDSKAEWKIVFGHHPFYASAEHGVGELDQIKRLRSTLQPILREQRVVAYFCGHEHALEHHESEGIHFFVSGAGSKIRPLELNLEQSRFAMAKQGFMAVSLRPSAAELVIQVVDMEGQVAHVAQVKKPQPVRT